MSRLILRVPHFGRAVTNIESLAFVSLTSFVTISVPLTFQLESPLIHHVKSGSGLGAAQRDSAARAGNLYICHKSGTFGCYSLAATIRMECSGHSLSKDEETTSNHVSDE